MRVAAPNTTVMVSVFNDDGRCLGFVLARGLAGFESFDVNERSLGLFPTAKRAAKQHAEAFGGQRPNHSERSRRRQMRNGRRDTQGQWRRSRARRGGGAGVCQLAVKCHGVRRRSGRPPTLALRGCSGSRS
jgi:hypothetical protein